jgi:CRISPR system Cascade subunit CasA
VTLTTPPTSSNDLYDLRTRPWLPVNASHGATGVGLRELFLRAHEFTGLAVALPPAASGLMRVLYAMAARITGLHEAADAQEWALRRYTLLEDGRGFDPAAVEDYLSRHAAGLRLHDPVRPFLQDARLAGEATSTSGVNKLVMARPAGNNQVFFGHFTDRDQVSLSSAEAVLHLIAQLYYGPSGQCTPRIVDGRRYGNTMAGPLRRRLSYHPEGRTLHETLVLGIPAPGTWPTPQAGDPRTDGCPWERTEPLDPLAPPGGPVGPLSLLTEQYQHAILLRPGPGGDSVVDATITWALRENRPDHKDPYLLWDEGRDGTVRPRDAMAERALWRDLDALVLMNRGDSGRRPLIMDGLTGDWLPDEVFHALRVHAYGFEQDGQTRDRTYFSAATPELFALLESSDANADTSVALGAKEGREAAEKAAGHLVFALRQVWRAYTSSFSDSRPAKAADRAPEGRQKDAGPWPAMALAAYWPAAEELFRAALDAGDFTRSRRDFGSLALGIYDDVTRPVAHTPRGAKAREGARGIVRSLVAHSATAP